MLFLEAEVTKSLSNLLKQYNTIEPAGNVRMIDYNAMIDKKLSEIARTQGKTESAAEDGFQSLNAIANEVQEDYSERLLQAKAEAEALLQQARLEADAILESARTGSDEIFEQAKENGYQEGYRQGSTKAEDEIASAKARCEEELAQQRADLQNDYNREMRELEPKLLDVILTVVEKVFHIQFDDKKDILLHLVSNTIEDIEGCRSFRLRVGEEQKIFLEHHKDDILDRIGHDMTLEILSDVSLSGNQCIIETDTGVFDCSLGVQLENLIKDLKSLSS